MATENTSDATGMGQIAIRRIVLTMLLIVAFLKPGAEAWATTCTVLVYHRFGPVAADSMTTTTRVFMHQIQAMRAHGYRIVSLAELVETLEHRAPRPDNIVAITVDDGHRSVYTELFPVALQLGIPLTLFVYPSAIGRADYALDWNQLRVMLASGQIEIGSHTYWHPDFRRERQRLGAQAYAAFVQMQLIRSRAVLADRLQTTVRFLAWPYGIADVQLQAEAAQAGYRAAFVLGNRSTGVRDPLLALPRHMIVDAVGTDGLLRRLALGSPCIN